MYIVHIEGNMYPAAFWESKDAFGYLNAFGKKRGKKATFKFIPV